MADTASIHSFEISAPSSSPPTTSVALTSLSNDISLEGASAAVEVKTEVELLEGEEHVKRDAIPTTEQKHVEAPPGQRYATRMAASLLAEKMGVSSRCSSLTLMMPAESLMHILSSIVDIASKEAIEEFIYDVHRYVFLEFYAAWYRTC